VPRTLATFILATLSSTAIAGETFSLGAEVGASARTFDSLALADKAGFGGEVGARSELNLLVHLKVDARYMDGAIFSDVEHRLFETSFSGSSPALIVLALDVHELYARISSRPGDDLLYLHTGIGLKGKLGPVKLKGGLGFTYIEGDDSVTFEDRAHGLGAYVGLEFMLRTKWIDTNLRAATFAAFDASVPHFGLTTDGDLMVKIPVGKAAIGPRFDVAYRHLALNPGAGDLFAQRQEFSAHAGFAFHWGAGGK
jgi:hypothetical protein